jgi:6-phosphogluconate dehydrogenase
MKAVAAMRNQFGGHALHTAPPAGGDVPQADTSQQQAPPEQAPEAEAAGAGGPSKPSES